MVLIFFGEITNPLSQFYNIAGELCGLNPLTGADAPVMKRWGGVSLLRLLPLVLVLLFVAVIPNPSSLSPPCCCCCSCCSC